MPPSYGHRGVVPGAVFDNRRAVHAAGLHRQLVKGISGGASGSDAIVINGGYFDQDFGSVIIYTGEGGGFTQAGTGAQKQDQTLTGGNLGLVVAQDEGHPVRVLRGYKAHDYAPVPRGVRYDGLYRVESHWHDYQTTGKCLYRFRLVAVDQASLPAALDPGNLSPQAAERRDKVVKSLVRNRARAEKLKKFYDYECQMCGEIIRTFRGGRYAETAHIQPLGWPHNGPDHENNMLCLCPNCHKRFDNGSLVLTNELIIKPLVLGFASPDSKLRVRDGHKIKSTHVAYHRNLFS
jgi:putative restriction endonuclease